MEKSKDILAKYWGYNSFRPLQEDIVDSAIYGHDTLAILPTGGGKSICFQVPGLALEGITLVISPLIALMEDQVSNLQNRGIPASMITSGMNYREIDITLDNARFGNTKFLYTSPERLKSDLFIERYKSMNVGLIVVDEAHCISEWGHDFRPSYAEIAEIREIHPNVPVMALTASATKRVQDDIKNKLALKKPNEFHGSLERKNIIYNVEATNNKLNEVIQYCSKHPSLTGIVYCQTRKSVKNVAEHLRAHKVSAGIYHGGMNSEDRKYMLNEWLKGTIKVMVATNAFGMGIDKPNVRFVLHFEIPTNLEAYYQEAGRAGRDGESAYAIAFWEQKDIDIMRSQLSEKYPETARIKELYNAVCNYLKVAIGSGQQETYNFDLIEFSKTFNFSISETFYSLKILQLNETLHFTEKSFHPTRLKFAIGNSALYKFQVGNSNVNNLITLLTRSYPGIFDRFIRINEKELSKRLKVSLQELKKQLLYLEQYGVADINFQTQLPQITFLTERQPENYLTISPFIYLNRKKIETDKLKAMINYISSGECRSKAIGSYFENELAACGQCDSCLQKASCNHTFDELTKIIPTLLPATRNELSNTLKINKSTIQKVLQFLLLQEIIRFENDLFVVN